MRSIARTGVAIAFAIVLLATGSGQARAQEPADDLQRLRDRIAALERQIAPPRNDAQSEILQELSRQIAALRQELAQEQANRAAAQAAQQQARERLQESVAALTAIQQRLASGDSQVAGDLDAAAPGLPPPAQEQVKEARAALEREDLAAARYSLTFAIALAQRAQLAP